MPEKHNGILLSLILGNKCNLQCKYCIQGNHSNTENSYEDIPANVYDFIKEFANHCTGKTPLLFYGGEPLLYFPVIKKVIKKLGDEHFHYCIGTNGKALNKHNIDFFNKHNVEFYISWDGKSSLKNRGYDVIADKRDLLLQLKNIFLFNCVMTNDNSVQEIAEVLDPFIEEYEKRHKTKPFVRFMPVAITENMNGVEYTPERYRQDIHYLLNRQGHSTRAFQEHIVNTYSAYLSGNLLIEDKLFCRKGQAIPIKANGEIVSCLNTNTVVSDIHHSVSEIVAAITRHNYHQERLAQCRKCPYQIFCETGCPNFTEKEHEYFCIRSKIFCKILLDELKNLRGGEDKDGSK